MCADLVMAFVLYGWRTLWSLRKEFYLEILIQITSWVMFIYYYAQEFSSVQKQINVVQGMTIVLFMRLPIVSVLFTELHDIMIIVETTKRMASPFLSILFSMYLFMETYCIAGQILYSGCVTYNDMRII